MSDIIYFDECGSTNTYLMENTFPLGTAVAARSQTAGRGRRGREWLNLGTALHMSVLLSPAGGVASVFALSAAVALSRAVERLWDVPVYVKWSNDILVCLDDGNLNGNSDGNGAEYRKICGILCESSHGSIVVGAGLNLSRNKQQENIFPHVGYINDITHRDITFEQAAEVVYAEIMSVSQVPFTVLKAEYERRCVNINREVRIITPSGERTAVAVGINDDGSLLCGDDSGSPRDSERFSVYSGEVSIRGLNGYV